MSSFPSLRFLIRMFIRGMTKGLLAVSLAVLLLSPLSSPAAQARPLLAATPTASISAPASLFIGQDFTFTVTFDNTDADTGYGPFLDLLFPVNGADGAAGTATPDGIDFNGATYLGVGLTATELTFPDADGGGPGTTGCVDHPYAQDTNGDPLQVCGTAGDKLVVLLLPFGSFTPDQPPLEVEVSASLSDLADLGVDLTLKARAGFQYGETPLDDWCCDPVIVNPTSDDGSGWPSAEVTPTLVTLSKTADAPENETATGPNFPRSYTISIDVADGQTVTDLDVFDDLPTNVVYQGATTAGTIFDQPLTDQAYNPPDNQLHVNFASVTGGAGPDATVTVNFYVPEFDADGSSVIDPNSGDDVTSENQVNALGDWSPLDGRDSGGTDNVVADGSGPEHTLNDRSIAIQKSVGIAVDNGASGLSPFDILEYTLSYQISDYFTFGDLVVTDTFSDGQDYYSSYTPQFSATDRNGTVSGSITPTVVVNGDGSTTLTFDLSQAIDDNGGADGILQGGRAIAPDAGGATGSITFRTEVQDAFDVTFPSGDASVDQGDVLDNDVTIDGSVRDNDAIGTTVGTEADTSSASSTIGRGDLSKTIYAVNGNTSFSSPPQVAPTDTITYRLVYTLPTSDVENLEFVDYLPLPVFDASEVTTFNSVVDANSPAAGTAKFGPSDTFFAKSGITPTLSTSGPSANNSVTFTYGDYDDTGSEATVVDLLFTVTVTDDPFADGLFLTNQATAGEGSTNAGDQSAESIIQIQIQEPVLVMTKGTIGFTPGAGGTFSPSTTGPVGFSDPGSSNPRWSGTIDSNGLASDPVDSDLSGVDAGDLVSFAIVIENQGSSPDGAFDIQLRDTLPTGFQIPSGGAGGNLSVTRGDGTSLSIVEPNSSTTADINDLFSLDADGIELVDPAVDEGACQVYDPSSGRNIVVITYDLEVSPDVPPGEEIVNLATVFNYANQEGGQDFTGSTDDLTDDATVTVDLPLVDKTFVTTNQAHTSDRDVAIGEQVTYQVVITVPEGESQTELVDDLDRGLAFVSMDSISASAALSTSIGTFNDVLSNVTYSNIGSGAANQGRRATLDFGTLTNSDTDNSTDETITIQYTAVVINGGSNDRGDRRNNDANWNWSANGGTETVDDSAPNVTIVEPTLQVVKSASPTTGDAGDTITFDLVVSHTGASDADAFELELEDVIPTGMTYVGGSLTNSAGEAPDTLTESSGTINATWSGLQLGQTSTLQFQVTLDSTVSAGQVITNSGEIQWTSLPGDVTSAQTANNSLSVERTGDTTDVGGSANDYLATDDADVTIFSAPTKSIDVTSESHTSAVSGEERLAIGEIVRYRLTFRLAEGTTADFQLRDRLPAGMRFLNDDTATVAFVANDSGMSSSTLGTSPQQTGNETNVGSLNPTFTLPDTAVSTSPTTNSDSYGSGTDVYFKLGTLTNDDRDDDEEFIVVEFNAVLENVAGNQAYNNSTGASTPTELDNDFQVRVDGSTIATSNTESVWVAEPSITNVLKQATTVPSDAGDTVVYQITFTNQATGSNGAAAFDLQLTDTLDSDLNSASVSSVTVSDPSGATVINNSSGLTIDLTISQLNPGGTVTVEITASVDDDAPIAATINNDAQLTYTSLPGSSGTTSNATGSDTPGAAGSATGERTGDDGQGGALNDYADSDDLALALDDPAISKVVTDSSVATTGTGQIDVNLTDLVIGETVTFTITATLPEGESTIVITDELPTLPDGVLSVVSSEVLSIGGQISGSSLSVGDAGVASDGPDADSLQDTVEFDFGTVQNQPDGVSNSDDQLVVEVVALVENLSSNQNEDQLTNTATIDYDNGSQSATEDVEIVEPLLNITKVADDDTPALGQTVTYTVTVEHETDSHADAEDIVIVDTIPSGLSYVAGSASLPPAQVDESGDPTIEFTLPSLTLADDSTSFTYQATVDSPPSANVGDVLQNTQAMTWTSISGPDADERDGDGGVDDYSDSANESVTVTGIDLTLDKDDGGISAVPGDTIAYTLTIENVGNADATGVEITDDVPQYTTFNPTSSTAGWSCAPDNSAGSTCTFAYGALAAGASDTLTFAVDVDATVPALVELINNSASITDDGNNGPEPTPSDNSDSDSTPLGAVPDLAVTKDDGESIISDGTVLTYAIEVQNIGDQDATGVEATDTIPDNTTFNPGGSSAGWTCSPDNDAGSVCTYIIGDLDAGDSVNLTFQVTVDSPLPDGVTSITNTIEVDEDGTNGPEPDETNNTDTDVDNIATDVNSDLTKSIDSTNQTFTSGGEVAIGELVTYELVLTVPDGTMRSVLWTDSLDQGLAFVSCESLIASTTDLTSTEGAFSDICDAPTVTPALGSSANPADDGREISFDLGDLENTSGSDATLTLRYTAAVLNASENSRGDQLNNSAEVDWVGDGLTAAAGNVTIVEPTLTLEKSVAPEVVLEGGLVTFTLTVEHTSSTDADAFDLVLGDELPPELIYEPGTLAWTGVGVAPSSLDDSSAPTLEITWANFPEGSQSEIEYSARLSGVGPGESVSNDAFLQWSSLPGDVSTSQSSFNSLATERLYDPGSPVNVYGVGSSASVSVPALPATGFAPDRVTELAERPPRSPYQELGGLALRIDKLGLETDIVGVSTDSQGWDLTWLSNQAGYLEGTAFPTLPGNTALTGHVYLADGTPGPFNRLGELGWGDEVSLISGGSRYVYQVRQVFRVLPSNLSVLGHEQYDWLTLITCEGYYEPTDSYLRRLVVRAVLISVEPLP